MSRVGTFTRRNLLEMSRDALSYIFCIAFPLVMLVIMTIVNQSIPKEGVTIFQIDNLAGGITIFGLTFVMLFTAITVAKDRAGAFLTRLYATPMKSGDFTKGYILPMLIIAGVQAVISFAASFVVSLITGSTLNVLGILLAIVTLIPPAVMFIAIGLIFGTLFNEKSAPGICSIIISLGSFLGGIWFDAEQTGGVMLTICKCLPFFYCTKAVRSAIKLDITWDTYFLPLIIVTVIAVVLVLLASVAFRRKMKADLG